MRKIFTLCLLSITCYSYSQPNNIYSSCFPPKIMGTPAKELTVKVPVMRDTLTRKVTGIYIYPGKSDTITRKHRCGATITGNNQPLWILDGIPQTPAALLELDPNTIDSIWILKEAAASALYGSRGANGAIIVSTKKISRIIIKDFSDGSPVAGATVLLTSLINKNEKIQFVANDSGIVLTKKLNGFARCLMTISAVGHITTEQVLETYGSKEKEIFLHRDIKTGPDVVVSVISCSFKKETLTCNLYCLTSGCTIRMGKEKPGYPLPIVPDLNIYPNPVQRGAAVNLQFKNTAEEQKTIRVVSLDGKVLLQQKVKTTKGNNFLQLSTDIRWSAGIYFLQLLYENGKILASDKIIIQ